MSRILFFLIFAGGLLGSCFRLIADDTSDDLIPRLLSPVEIAEKIRDAGQGNERAAFQLYLHYAKSRDDAQAEVWLRRAASGKWADAQYALAHVLAWQKKKYDEAHVWADRAVKNGCAKAAKLIVDIEFMQKHGYPPPPK